MNYRTALVINQLVYNDFEAHLPGASSKMFPGSFGENFIVNHPRLHPSEACIGDVYRIGKDKEGAIFEISGPRMPCPKVDAYLGLTGVTALGRKTGWTGYFFKVVKPGICRKHDEIVLLERPYPGMSITRVARGLWGSAEEQESTEEFFETLAGIECLIPRHYRDVAAQRLERLRAEA
jgi:MOSC domain-containing protein YiiM